jgi:hypothetical protein
MRRWTAGAAAVGALGLAAAMGAAAGEGAKARFPERDPSLDRFLFFATLEGLCEDSMPDDAVKAALEKDAKGRYRNFVYACPVCSPVVEAFRAYAMRWEFYFSRKGDPLTPWTGADNPSPVADIAARLAGADPGARGAALHDFVGRCVERRLERLRLTPEETARWRQWFAEARKKGMAALPRSEGFQHKSCPSCDGSCGDDDAWK